MAIAAAVLSLRIFLLSALYYSPSAFHYPEEALPTDSGYLPINRSSSSSSSSSSSLYFAFYEAQKPLLPLASTPLLIWLQGGPGCSSMVGNLFEMGPFLISEGGSSIRRNPFSWNLRFGLIFIDSPLGTGFSAPVESPSSIPSDEATIASHLLSALQTFLLQRPSFLSRPIFLTGESYAGKYVPAAASLILQQNPLLPPSLRINLAGIAVGNGFTHPEAQVRTHAAAAYFSGLINFQQRAQLEKLQARAVSLAQAARWVAASDVRNQVLRALENATGLATLYDVRRTSPYRTAVLAGFLNREEVKAALRTRENAVWAECSGGVRAALHPDVMKSAKRMVEDVLRAETRVLLYQGIFDLRDGPVSTLAWLRDLRWDGLAHFFQANRTIWRVRGNLAGYLQKWRNLNVVVVSNAGHLVPADQPRNAQAMIQDWVMRTADFRK